MQGLGSFPGAARVKGVFCDIDDTLTTEGRLTAEAYSAMERLRTSGRLVVPVTGRPAGWCDHIARMWPVDAVVGENGAFYFCYDPRMRRLAKRFVDDEATRLRNRTRLTLVRERILREFPDAAVASDQLYRESDLAIDFCEDVPRLPEEAIRRIIAIMEDSGMTAKMSSIHVNGWFGCYDKLRTTKLLMRERFGVDLDLARDDYVFVGDSPNDAPMFEYFSFSVGVANARDFGERLAHAPAFLTGKRCSAGFAELADLIISAGVAR